MVKNGYLDEFSITVNSVKEVYSCLENDTKNWFLTNDKNDAMSADINCRRANIEELKRWIVVNGEVFEGLVHTVDGIVECYWNDECEAYEFLLHGVVLSNAG